MAREPLRDETPLSAEPEMFDDSPLDLSLVLLAAWLPIAGAMLALATEGTSPNARPEREPGGEISLD